MDLQLNRRKRLLVFSTVAFAATVAVACGGEDARDEALAGLDRATEAAGLETEMAGLVSDVSTETLASAEAAEQAELEEALDDLDSRAEDLIASADTGQEFDEEIASSAEQTQGAGTELASAIDEPATIDAAKETALQNLQASNQGLTSATELIGTELQDENGNLSAEDAAALEATVADVTASGEAIAAAGSSCEVEAFNSESVGLLEVRVVSGDLDCAEATDIFEQYYAGEEGVLVPVEDWSCSTPADSDYQPGDQIGGCSRGSDSIGAFIQEGNPGATLPSGPGAAPPSGGASATEPSGANGPCASGHEVCGQPIP